MAHRRRRSLHRVGRPRHRRTRAAGACSRLLTPSHAFSRLPTPSHAFPRLLTPSHAFSRLPTPSHAFPRLLTPSHAFSPVAFDSCDAMQICGALPAVQKLLDEVGERSASHTFSRLLTPSHAFSRLHTPSTPSRAFSRPLAPSHAFSGAFSQVDERTGKHLPELLHHADASTRRQQGLEEVPTRGLSWPVPQALSSLLKPFSRLLTPSRAFSRLLTPSRAFSYA